MWPATDPAIHANRHRQDVPTAATGFPERPAAAVRADAVLPVKPLSVCLATRIAALRRTSETRMRQPGQVRACARRRSTFRTVRSKETPTRRIATSRGAMQADWRRLAFDTSTVAARRSIWARSGRAPSRPGGSVGKRAHRQAACRRPLVAGGAEVRGVANPLPDRDAPWPSPPGGAAWRTGEGQPGIPEPCNRHIGPPGGGTRIAGRDNPCRRRTTADAGKTHSARHAGCPWPAERVPGR